MKGAARLLPERGVDQHPSLVLASDWTGTMRKNVRKVANGASFFVLLSLAIIFSVAVSAQDPVKARAQLRNLRGRNPKPEDATKAILDALNRYEVVAMGGHMAIKTSTTSFSTSSAILPFQAR